MIQILPLKVQIDILGSKRLTVLTNSLTEVIEPGDVVIVKKINMEDILVGDIICFLLIMLEKGT